MKNPIFRYYDQFNEVYSKPSSSFKSLSEFFRQYEAATSAGNGTVLEQYIGRTDRNDMPLCEGDIIELSYHYPGNEGQPGGNDPGDSGHFIGAIRYQPSKGYVMSRIIKASDNAEPGQPYEKIKGSMSFAICHTTKIGNINQHPELLTDLEK